MDKTKLALGVALVALVIAIIGVFTPAGSAVQNAISSFGGTTNYDEVDATAMKIGGANGSRIGPFIATSCSLLPSNYTFTATTTVAVDCAVTGVVSGDVIVANFASTTSAAGAGWIIQSAAASSTSGFVTFHVLNLTGVNALIPGIGIASSTEVLIAHPLTSVPGL